MVLSSQTRPILITGSHRSGSTWVGKMVAASPSVAYISEPFNPAHSRGIFNATTDRWFTCVSGADRFRYESALRDTIAFHYALKTGLGSLQSPRGLARVLVEYSNCLLYGWQKRRALLKDPIALFSAEWIASTFDAQVVVIVRHPAAFVNSLIKAQWRHPFSHFLDQAELMATRLAPFRDEIERMAREKHDIVDEGILLWRIMHRLILDYRKANPGWLFVRHEDLSGNPIDAFDAVFNYLKIEYTPAVKKTVRLYTRSGNPIERGETGQAFARLDSRRNVDRWMQRLSAEQIQRIRERSADVWPAFYSNDDWEPAVEGSPYTRWGGNRDQAGPLPMPPPGERMKRQH
ncbi:MAG: sulfotransferase [Terriglobia bacterium]